MPSIDLHQGDIVFAIKMVAFPILISLIAIPVFVNKLRGR